MLNYHNHLTDEEKTAFIKKSPEEQQAYLESLTPSREDKIEANNSQSIP